jgi:hypothetical protein
MKVDPTKAQHPVTVSEGLLVAMTVTLEVTAAGMPAAAVSFDDESPRRDQCVDALVVVRTPGEARLTLIGGDHGMARHELTFPLAIRLARAIANGIRESLHARGERREVVHAGRARDEQPAGRREGDVTGRE